MLSKMLAALAVAVLVAVAATFAPSLGWMTLSVTPMREPAATAKPLPTFSQVQARLEGRADDAPVPDLAAAPWARAEKSAQMTRAHVRSVAFRALDEIHRPSCQRNDSQALNYYFEQRRMQERGYAASWGPPGAEFIAQAWTTPEDLRIVNAMRDAYEGGWLAAEALEPQYREHLFRLIGPATQRRSVCK